MDKKFFNKGTIALGLLAMSGAFFLGFWLYTGDLVYISKYFYIHLAFLPIHALVLGLILDELIQAREKIERRKRLNMFLGIFFRQMGLDIMLNMLPLVGNREDLEERLLVDKAWKGRHFRRARRELGHVQLSMRPDREELANLLDMLAERENDIIAMTRNPLMLEFESLYRCLLALFHLIEETQFRGAGGRPDRWRGGAPGLGHGQGPAAPVQPVAGLSGASQGRAPGALRLPGGPAQHHPAGDAGRRDPLFLSRAAPGNARSKPRPASFPAPAPGPAASA